jgi:DNA repair exonuclease SbcCD nuclease subunit
VVKNQLSEHISSGKRNVIVGHFMLEQSITGEDPDSFSINELILPIKMFECADVVVMGHVHKHMVLSKSNPLAIYTGSMDRVSFGEKHHSKSSIILDTDNLLEAVIIDNDVRAMAEIEIDLAAHDKEYKTQINNKIVSEIERFAKKTDLKDVIVKLLVKIKDNDAYYINNDKVKEFIYSKQVYSLPSLQILPISHRQLRNKDITETVDSKQAIESFINGLGESDLTKGKLIKMAKYIIEEVNNKQ